MSETYETKVNTIIQLMDFLYNPKTKQEFKDALHNIADDMEKQGTDRLKKYLNDNMDSIVKKYYVEESK